MGARDDLYQGLILDHSRNPRGAGPLPGATHTARGDNPFCGDRVAVAAIVAGDRITDVRFEGSGCALSTASASMMTAAVQGLTRAGAEALFQRLQDVLAGGGGGGEDLGDLAAFSAAARYPARAKCARLPWQTLLAALADTSAVVSTE